MKKISLDKLPGFSALPPGLKDNPKAVFSIIAVLGVAVAALTFLGGRETKNIRKSFSEGQTPAKADSFQDKDVGVLTGAADTKSYVARIEKQYYDISAKSDGLNDRIGKIEQEISALRKNQSEVSKIVMDFDKKVSAAVTGNFPPVNEPAEQANPSAQSEDNLRNFLSLSRPPVSAVNLESAKVGEIKEKDNLPDKRYVYLPLGSFVKCTLLTGVYAPADANNPLPVLISVDEAFYGPNGSRVPLKGAFAIGKAVGDVVSKRAIIQVVSFSTVLPSGEVFEHEANLGYLADKDGRLGIPGELIYNTGRQLGLDFLSGFLAGGAEALSQAETSTVTGAYGQTSRNVTGNTGRYAMFSGLARSAEGMAGYYQKQLENMIPAVKIDAGSKAVFVIQKGVQIEGLEIHTSDFGYIE